MTLIVGIDIGTTSLKVSCIKFYTKNEFEIIDCHSLSYKKRLNENKNFYSNFKELIFKTGEINSFLILDTLEACLKEFDINLISQVEALGFCGQMHGCLYWQNKLAEKIIFDDKKKTFNTNDLSCASNLITWEDQRCSKEFLNELNKNTYSSQQKCYTGYALATTFWFLKNNPNFLKKFDKMGSIMDFIIQLLCNNDHPKTSIQLANSYGFFDFKNKSWDNFLKENEFPMHLLPSIINDNEIAGLLNYDWINFKKNIPIFVGLGDLQCTVYSYLYDKENTAILNSGTSMQLAFITDEKKIDKNYDLFLNSHLDFIPYFDNKILVSASSLNGGNVLMFFVESVKKFITDLLFDLNINNLEDKIIFSRLDQLAKKFLNENKNDLEELNIIPRLFGERYEKIKSKFSINSITENNFELGKIYYYLCKSIINNIFLMISIVLLRKNGINKICGLGTTLNSNEILKICLQEKLINEMIELVYEKQAEAHIGITLITFKNYSKLLKNQS